MRERFRPSTGTLWPSFSPLSNYLEGKLLTVVALYRAINLTKNSQFYVRQGDVERLIAQGYLQRLS